MNDNKNIEMVEAGQALIWDDLMNERSLENGYVPTNLANPPIFVTKPKGPEPGSKPTVLPDDTKTMYERSTLDQSRSGQDTEMPVPSSSNKKEGEEPSPYSVERLNASVQEAIKKYKIEAAGKSPTYEKAPSKTNYPPNINQTSLSLWPEFWAKYGKTCKNAGPTLDKQWACTLAIWRNYTLKRRKAPFDAKASYLNQDTQDYMLKRMATARAKMEALANKVLRNLNAKGFIKRILKERVIGIDFNERKKRYSLTTGCSIRLTVPFNSSDFRTTLKANGFSYTQQIYVRSIETGQDVIFTSDVEDNSAVFTTTQYLNEQQVKYILGATDENLKDTALISRKLGVFLKTMVKDSPMTISLE